MVDHRHPNHRDGAFFVVVGHRPHHREPGRKAVDLGHIPSVEAGRSDEAVVDAEAWACKLVAAVVAEPGHIVAVVVVAAVAEAARTAVDTDAGSGCRLPVAVVAERIPVVIVAAVADAVSAVVLVDHRLEEPVLLVALVGPATGSASWFCNAGRHRSCRRIDRELSDFSDTRYKSQKSWLLDFHFGKKWKIRKRIRKVIYRSLRATWLIRTG